MTASIVFLVIGFAILIYSGDCLVRGALAAAYKSNISPLLVGILTVMAFAWKTVTARFAEGSKAAVGGGVESISLVQMSGQANRYRVTEEELMKTKPELWMAMIETADIVAKRYNVARDYQDEYSLRSQQRIAAAQKAGLFNDEIVPMATKMKVVNKFVSWQRNVKQHVVPRKKRARLWMMTTGMKMITMLSLNIALNQGLIFSETAEATV